METCLQGAGLSRQSAIRVAVVNGMGRGYGDNVSDMGALQHFRRFLDSRYKQVTIDLLQRNCAIQSVVHTRYGSIDDAIKLPITVSQFFKYDVNVDLSDLLSIPLFNDLPLYDLFLHGLSMQRETVNDECKRTALKVVPAFTAVMRRTVEDESGCSEGAGRVVLFHPSASTPLRSMPPFLVERILTTLLAVEDVVVILCVNPGVQVQDRRVVDMRAASADICAFFGIIACCDAVITVGTVVYHVSSTAVVFMQRPTTTMRRCRQNSTIRTISGMSGFSGSRSNCSGIRAFTVRGSGRRVYATLISTITARA